MLGMVRSIMAAHTRGFFTSRSFSKKPIFRVLVTNKNSKETFAVIRSNEQDQEKLLKLGDLLKVRYYEVHQTSDDELIVAQTRKKLLHDIDEVATEVEHQVTSPKFY